MLLISRSLRLLSFTVGTALVLSGCNSLRSDIKSNDPVVSAQAQRVKDLEQQIDNQKKLVETEEAKLKSLQYQRKSAEQELKARKL